MKDPNPDPHKSHEFKTRQLSVCCSITNIKLRYEYRIGVKVVKSCDFNPDKEFRSDIHIPFSSSFTINRYGRAFGFCRFYGLPPFF